MGGVSKAFFTRNELYFRYDVETSVLDTGYPKPLTSGWVGLQNDFAEGIDAAIDFGLDKLYWFLGAFYIRIDKVDNRVAEGPLRIDEHWGGFDEARFSSGIDAAVNWGDGKAYFFRGRDYIQYDIASDTVDPGHPAPIAGNWPGMEEIGFADGVDAAVNWGDGKVYFFRSNEYARYGIGVGVDDGYPKDIAGNWPGLPRRIDACWLRGF
jgi:Hemopexin